MYAVATIETEILHMCYEVEAFKELRLMSRVDLDKYLTDLKADSKYYDLDSLDIGEATSAPCDAKHIYSLEILRVY